MGYRQGMILVVALSACAAKGQISDEAVHDEVEAEAVPLMTIDLGDLHTVELYDFGRGARMIDEYAPNEDQLLVSPTERSFVAIFNQLRPGQVVPAILEEADLSLTQQRREPGVSVVRQAETTDAWKKKTGGCNACPLGDVQRDECKIDTSNN